MTEHDIDLTPPLRRLAQQEVTARFEALLEDLDIAPGSAEAERLRRALTDTMLEAARMVASEFSARLIELNSDVQFMHVAWGEDEYE